MVRLPRKHLPASPLLQPGPQPPACSPHPLGLAGSDRPGASPGGLAKPRPGPHPERREGRGAAAAPGTSHPALGAPAPPGRGGGEGNPPRRPSDPPAQPGDRGTPAHEVDAPREHLGAEPGAKVTRRPRAGEGQDLWGLGCAGRFLQPPRSVQRPRYLPQFLSLPTSSA